MTDLALKAYRQDLAYVCLEQAKRPCSASDLSELMGVTAMNEGHPERCWRGISPPNVSGILKTLEGRRLVKKSEQRPNGRNGRSEPLWVIRPNKATIAMPEPPLHIAISNTAAALSRRTVNNGPAPTARLDDLPGSSYDDWTRPQLYTLLEIQSDITEACARFIGEVEKLKQSARVRLAAMGMEIPT